MYNDLTDHVKPENKKIWMLTKISWLWVEVRILYLTDYMVKVKYKTAKEDVLENDGSIRLLRN